MSNYNGLLNEEQEEFLKSNAHMCFEVLKEYQQIFIDMQINKLPEVMNQISNACLSGFIYAITTKSIHDKDFKETAKETMRQYIEFIFQHLIEKNQVNTDKIRAIHVQDRNEADMIIKYQYLIKPIVSEFNDTISVLLKFDTHNDSFNTIVDKAVDGLIKAIRENHQKTKTKEFELIAQNYIRKSISDHIESLNIHKFYMDNKGNQIK